MTKPYLVNIPKSISEDYEQWVVNIIRENHPKYLQPGAVLDREYVELIFDLYSKVTGLSEPAKADYGFIAAFFRSLQHAFLVPLVSKKIVCAILDTAGDLAIEHFFQSEQERLEDQADMICMTGQDYFLRGSARLELRRLAEAFDDLNRACSCPTVNPAWKRCRADLMIQSGMAEEACKDLIIPYEFSLKDMSTVSGIISAFDEQYEYIRLFKRCGNTDLLVHSSLRLAALLKPLPAFLEESADNMNDMIFYTDIRTSGMLNINHYFGCIGEILEELAAQGIQKGVLQALSRLEELARTIERKIGLLRAH